MEFFTFLSKDTIHLPPNKKVISADAITTLMNAKQILESAEKEALDYREEVSKECELLKERAELAGFDAGLNKWTEQIAYLEKEIIQVRKDMENVIVPLAMTAAKKIVGREIELKPETIVDIVATALKAVAQHRRVVIYVNRSDYDQLEAHRPRLKQIFEHLESLAIHVREDVASGGCIIETEAGIINAQLENQWTALENAFHLLLKTKKKE